VSCNSTLPKFQYIIGILESIGVNVSSAIVKWASAVAVWSVSGVSVSLSAAAVAVAILTSQP
jgi:hypothetical protein